MKRKYRKIKKNNYKGKKTLLAKCKGVKQEIIKVWNHIFKRCKPVCEKVIAKVIHFLENKLSRFSKRILEAGVTAVFLACLWISAMAAPAEQIKTESEIPENEFYVSQENMIAENTQTSEPDDMDKDPEEAESGKLTEYNEEYISVEKTGTRYVSATCVNFRQGPSLETEVLDKLYRNTKVELLNDEVEGFSLIRYKGQIGYMYTEYLSEEEIKVEYKPQNDYGHITDLRQRVATLAKNNQGTQPCLSGYCAKWVSGIYQAAGIGYPGGHAIDYWNRWSYSGSTRTDNIPVGAVVVGSGSGSELGNQYGHVGIYLGNGMVADNVGYHRIISLQDWIAGNIGTCQGHKGFIGWVWPYGTPF